MCTLVMRFVNSLLRVVTTGFKISFLSLRELTMNAKNAHVLIQTSPKSIQHSISSELTRIFFFRFQSSDLL